MSDTRPYSRQTAATEFDVKCGQSVHIKASGRGLSQDPSLSCIPLFRGLETFSRVPVLPKANNPTYSGAKTKLHQAAGAKDRAYGAYHRRRKRKGRRGQIHRLDACGHRAGAAGTSGRRARSRSAADRPLGATSPTATAISEQGRICACPVPSATTCPRSTPPRSARAKTSMTAG